MATLEMFITATLFLSALLSSVLLMAMKAVSDRGESGVSKESAFECGFNTMSSNRMPFSIQFFLIALIFLVFDVEVVLLFPFPLCEVVGGQSEMFIFLGVLTGGLIYEWEIGALWWSS